MQRLDPFPNKDEIKMKDGFEERYRSLLGDRFDEFLRYSYSYINKSIRVNTLKQPVEVVKQRLAEWNLVSIPWCPEGFWINPDGDRYDIGNLMEHQLGYLYIQEAASMIPPQVLNPRPGDAVLDMCAAPGSKTTQCAALMDNEGIVVANDVSGNRLKSLGINTQKCGVRNMCMTRMPGRQFAKKGTRYDKVLLDPPCSGTGTIRTSLKTLNMWSPHLVNRMKGTQRQLIQAGFDVLKRGGVMTYSTCTLEPEENEGIVTYLLERNDDAELVDIDLDINRSPAVQSFDDNDYHEHIAKCLRIYPQDNNTEGFFVAKIRKETT